MKKYLNINFIIGVVLCVFGLISLFKKDAFFLVDFIIGIANLLIFYDENKKRC